MIRVLNILPWGFGYGGVETTVMNYYRNIDHSKVQFDFLVPDNDNHLKHPYESEAISLGARIFRFQKGRINKRPIKYIEYITYIIKNAKIIKQNPDIKIVHIHDDFTERVAVDLLTAKLAGIPVRIVYSANTSTKRWFLHKIFRPLVRAVATHYMAGSTEAGVHMFGKKGKDRIIILPRARDLEVFRYNPERRRIMREYLELEGNYVIAYVANIRQQKNHSFLLVSFALALREDSNMILLLVGEGNLRGKLEIQVQTLGLGDNVRFLGQRNDVPDILQAADLFVLPSLFEGQPGTAIEAQAAGLPCLLSDQISPGAKITDLAEFLPIDKGPEIWAKKIKTYKGFDRRDTFDEMRDAGYDIYDASRWLEGFYSDALISQQQ